MRSLVVSVGAVSCAGGSPCGVPSSHREDAYLFGSPGVPSSVVFRVSVYEAIIFVTPCPYLERVLLLGNFKCCVEFPRLVGFYQSGAVGAVSGDMPGFVALEAFAALGVFVGFFVLRGAEIHWSAVMPIAGALSWGPGCLRGLPSASAGVGGLWSGCPSSSTLLFLELPFVNAVVDFDREFYIFGEKLRSFFLD